MFRNATLNLLFMILGYTLRRLDQFKLKLKKFLCIVEEKNSVIPTQYLQEFLEDIDTSTDEGRFEDVLNTIRKSCTALRCSKELEMEKVHLPDIDRRVQKIGRLIYLQNCNSESRSLRQSNNINIIVATEVYSSGGHSSVIDDIARYLKYPSILILTDIFDNYSSGQLSLEDCKSFTETITSVVIPKMSLCSKIQTLQEFLCKINPRNIWMVAHHEDVVCYAACNDSLNSKLIYLHHCDYNPTLGATTKSYIHVDLMEMDRAMCIDANVKNPLLLPLYVSKPPSSKKIYSQELNGSATSGRQNKFVFEGDLAYPAIVAEIINKTNRIHYHIGDLSQQQLNSIKTHLEENLLNPDLFQYVGRVESVAKALVDLKVSTYITSAPIPGGKTFVEALAANVAILSYVDKSNEKLLYRYHAKSQPHGVLTWNSVDDLGNKLATIDIQKQLKISALLYEENYSQSAFKKKLLKLEE